MNFQTLIPAPPRDDSCVEDSCESPRPIRGRRILVADDEGMRRLISSVLAGVGFAVNAAADGEQAWEQLHHEHYDLLVTDNEMPRLAGIKLIERMREEGMGIPIIIASGSLSAENHGN
jgi:CheY-like chemotaxis protein